MVSAPKLSTQVTAWFAWFALALCSVASPSLVLAPTQAGIEEHHETASHAVFLEEAGEREEAGEDTESSHRSDDLSSESISAPGYSFRFSGFSGAQPVSAAGQPYGRGVLLVFAARGPPTA